MNIDNNEQPEEEPIAEVQEFIDEEEITDHQAVADVLSEGIVYPEPITEERVRDVVNDVLGEADPEIVEVLFEAEQPVPEHTVQDVRDRMSQIDVSQIPPGVNTADFVRHFQATGTILTNSTAVDSSYQGTASATDASDGQGFTSAELIQDLVGPEKKPTKDDDIEELPELSANEIAEIRREKRILQLSQTKMKEVVMIKDMNLEPNDLIISFSSLQRGIMHTDLSVGANTSILLEKRQISRRRRPMSMARGSTSKFIFDKNGNRLTVDTNVDDGKGTIIKTRRDIPRIREAQLNINSGSLELKIDRFVIIDKDIFLQSRGRIWKIRYRSSSVSPEIMLRHKRKMINSFTEMEYGVQRLRDIMIRQFAENEYEIFYTLDFTSNEYNRFQLFGKFSDITIKNSIELERYIGDMIVSKDGCHFKGYLDQPELKIRLENSVTGTRTTFTPNDAILKYQHSHLTSCMRSNSNFCTGMENYRGNDTYDTELDIEMTFVRLREFVQWESLEGGPHMRMEEMSIHGSKIPFRYDGPLSQNVSERYKTLIIEKIQGHEQGFNMFKNCFILQPDKRGNLRYIVDFPKFCEIIISFFPKEQIEMISRRGLEAITTYQSGGNFYRLRDNDLSNPSSVRARAIEGMGNFVPLYLNGKYVRPQLIEERNVESVTYSPNPYFIRALAKYIHYNLIIELEHGSRDNS